MECPLTDPSLERFQDRSFRVFKGLKITVFISVSPLRLDYIFLRETIGRSFHLRSDFRLLFTRGSEVEGGEHNGRTEHSVVLTETDPL